jgi:hypothetical protein
MNESFEIRSQLLPLRTLDQWPNLPKKKFQHLAASINLQCDLLMYVTIFFGMHCTCCTAVITITKKSSYFRTKYL